jgi:hypothetical protein
MLEFTAATDSSGDERATKITTLAVELGELVAQKNKAYGNAFGKTGTFLKLLYPDGITPDQYGDALCIVRIFDKLMRIATNPTAYGESPFRDIAGYGLLGSLGVELVE